MFITHIFVFISYSAFSLYLLATDEIKRFVSPKLIGLTYLSGFSLAFFLWILFFRLDRSEDNLKDKKNLFKEILKGLLFIYPIILFFAFRPSDISSVNIPSVKLLPLKKQAVDKPVLTSLPVDADGYVRLNLFELWLIARNYPELAQKYRFKTIGSVLNVSKKNITLTRLFVTCCVADATPVEVDVFLKDDIESNKFLKGQLIEVSGGIIIKDYVIIIADSVNVLPKLSTTYIMRWSEGPPFNP